MFKKLVWNKKIINIKLQQIYEGFSQRTYKKKSIDHNQKISNLIDNLYNSENYYESDDTQTRGSSEDDYQYILLPKILNN